MGRRGREEPPTTAEELLLAQQARNEDSDAVKRLLELVDEFGVEEKRWTTTVGREVARHWFAGQLQKDCQAICRANKVTVKDVFEKWQCNLLICAGPEAEPLLEAPKEVDRHLLQELQADVGKSAADACLQQLYDTAERAREQFQHQQWNRRAGDKPVTAEENGRGGSMDVKCGKLNLKLNKGHLEKLLTLHETTERIVGERKGGNGKEDSGERKKRVAMGRIGSLLARYEALAGGGYQAALNGSSFATLQEHWAVEMECFASPLNCRFPRYCSAFPDTDVWFGSSGSFFEFFPSRGSFEANPPFVPSVVEAMTKHMHALLVAAEERGDALSFIVIIPTWRHTEGWRALNDGQFLRHHLLLRQKEHSYCEGSQHKRWKQAHRMSSCDTSVFWWQTSAASKAWPVTDAGIQALRHAFASTLSEMQRARCQFVSGTSGAVTVKAGSKRPWDGDHDSSNKVARLGESDPVAEELSSACSSKGRREAKEAKRAEKAKRREEREARKRQKEEKRERRKQRKGKKERRGKPRGVPD